MLYFESVIIIGLIALEVYLFYETYAQIQDYKGIFQKKPTVDVSYLQIRMHEDGSLYEFVTNESDSINVISEIKMPRITPGSDNEGQLSIISTINNYLYNNRGAAIDYHIIKEVVNRKVESEEEAIESKLPSPLYIGLAATMVGIIIGLVSIDFTSASIDAIKPLIDGVKVAMGASVIGLALTTYLSIRVYKQAKTELDLGKNEFMSLIQTKLLPSLMGSGESGMASLAGKLDEFSRTTNSAVSDLGSIVKNSNSQVKCSQELLRQIEHIDLSKVAGANERMFQTLSGLMDSFNAFPAYYNELNSSLSKTAYLVKQLSQFIDQTKDLDIVFHEIKDTITTSKDSADFFNRHIKEFIQYGSAVNKAIESADEKMTIAIETLQSSADGLFKDFQTQMEVYDQTLADSFSKTIDNFNKTATRQIELVTSAFENSRPQFEHLQHLVGIKAEMEKFNSSYSARMLDYQKSIDNKLESLIREVKSSARTQSHIRNTEGSQVAFEPQNLKTSVIDLILKGVVALAGLTILSYGIHSFYIFWF